MLLMGACSSTICLLVQLKMVVIREQSASNNLVSARDTAESLFRCRKSLLHVCIHTADALHVAASDVVLPRKLESSYGTGG